jgi:CHAT domain-containing protein
MGNYAKAETLFQRSLIIKEKALGPEHPDTALGLSDLAHIYIDENRIIDAAKLLPRFIHAEQSHLANILSFTSEQQRLAFQKTLSPYELSAALGVTASLAEIIIRQKGVVLDSLLEDRFVAEASENPQHRESITEARRCKQRLMQLILEAPKNLSDAAAKRRETEKQALSQRVEEIEAALARQVVGLGRARRALNVTVPQVQAALANDQVLIELLRYGHYLGKGKFEPRYGALLIASEGEPRWVPLGGAADIEKNVGLYQKSVRGKTYETTLSSVLKALNSQVWAPIEKALPRGTKTIIISPDGALNFVSFATLLTPDDRFVSEKYSVRYVASGRDLLQKTKAPKTPQTAIYANPDFDSKAAPPGPNRGSAVALRSMEMRDLESILFLPLPGTEAEAAALEKRAGKSAKLFLGANATEGELRQVNSPRVLHLATHGFFLPEVELGEEIKPFRGGEEIPKGKLVNPMHRSGLALAGAATTLHAWARGEVPPTENDGIVTAEEAGSLKLDGTWLVVLSACETGSGEARAGEGVMGLRRGFIQAGAQSLLMTLWPISDETTVHIMFDFYEAAFKSGNAPQSLDDVQRDWLIKLRKERGLLDAVRLAGPFIMSSQGKQ